MAQVEQSDRGFATDRLGTPSARGWLLALGTALLVLGLCASANLFLTTIATTYYVGMMMLVGGVLQIVHAFGVGTWRRASLWAVGGLLYLLAGLSVILNPLLAAATLTLVLAIFLAMAGVMRLWVAVTTTIEGRGWMVMSGMAGIAVAVIIGLEWPINTLWMLGLVLAVDLIFQGAALLAIGFSMKTSRAV